MSRVGCGRLALNDELSKGKMYYTDARTSVAWDIPYPRGSFQEGSRRFPASLGTQQTS